MTVTWNASDIGNGITLSNNNLTTAGAVYTTVIGIAVDFTHSKLWLINSLTQRWNGGLLAAQNPATNTGGVTLSVTGTVFPACSLDFNADTVTINCGASSFFNTMPAGFSAWGSSVTFDPVNKGGSISLTNGNLTATGSTAAGWQIARGTTGATSGLLYFEITVNSSGTVTSNDNGVILGVCNASQSLTTWLGNTSAASGAGWQNQSSTYGSGASGFTYFAGTTSNTWRSVRATSSLPSGKWYYEVIASVMTGTGNGILVGFCNSSLILFGGNGALGFPGDVNGISAQFGFNSIWFNNTNNSSSGAPGTNAWCGVAIDTISNLFWFYNGTTGKWNNDVITNQNPSTGTGGISTSFLTGNVYPVVAVNDTVTTTTIDRLIANFGATPLAIAALPTGFSTPDTFVNVPQLPYWNRRLQFYTPTWGDDTFDDDYVERNRIDVRRIPRTTKWLTTVLSVSKFIQYDVLVPPDADVSISKFVQYVVLAPLDADVSISKFVQYVILEAPVPPSFNRKSRNYAMFFKKRKKKKSKSSFKGSISAKVMQFFIMT